MWNSVSNVNFRVECKIKSPMWNSESNVKFRVDCKIHAPIFSYCPKYKIIVPNEKLLSAECECESECEGKFYVAEKLDTISNKIQSSRSSSRSQVFATLWPQPNCPGQCHTWLSQLGPRSGIIITLYPHHMFGLTISQLIINGSTRNFACWHFRWKGSSVGSKQSPCSTAVSHAALQNL